MAIPLLSPVEARILGCLLEKERTTPENYPLSLVGLAAACNQSTNREPVTAFDERTVDAGLSTLREKKLATLIHSAGARVGKYRHNFLDQFTLVPREVAILCVLMLRGPQTPGELRGRTERLAPPATFEEVEAVLEELCGGDDPLVAILPPRSGQKERRYVQLFSPVPAEPVLTPMVTAPLAPSRADVLDGEVAALKQDLASLREEFAAFRKQFE